MYVSGSERVFGPYFFGSVKILCGSLGSVINPRSRDETGGLY